MKTNYSLRIYSNMCHSFQSARNKAEAAAMARNLDNHVDILCEGRLIGIKKSGEHRINWV